MKMKYFTDDIDPIPYEHWVKEIKAEIELFESYRKAELIVLMHLMQSKARGKESSNGWPIDFCIYVRLKSINNIKDKINSLKNELAIEVKS